MATLLRVRGLLEAPIDYYAWFAWSFECSLSLEGEGYLSTFGGVAGILAKF